MKIKSVSGITCYVKDLKKTREFYEALGFLFRKVEENHITGYINWFWMDFVQEDTAEIKPEKPLEHKGEGVFIYLTVDDVDATYEEVLAKGLKPSGEPKDWPWGNREFVLRDPDGYKLVFFKKK